MNTTRKLPLVIRQVLGAFHDADHTEAVIAGPYVRDFLLLKDKFPVDGCCEIYVRIQNPNEVVSSGFDIRGDVNKDASTIKKMIYRYLPQHHIKSIGGRSNMVISNAGEFVNQVSMTLETLSGNFNFLICLIDDTEPSDYVGEFIINISRCLFDGEKYRLYQGFVDGYNDKVITIDSEFQKKNSLFAQGMLDLVSARYPEYEVGIPISKK